jgi:hypothetical protein
MVEREKSCNANKRSSMKLVRVEHIRCRDYSGRTFVLCPETWTEDEIEDKLCLAQENYLKALKDFQELGGKAPNKATVYTAPPYRDYPDKTVAEIDALWKHKQEEYAEWNSLRNNWRKSFATFLTDQGFTHLDDDEAECLEHSVDWDHRHETRIDYSETETDSFPPPDNGKDRRETLNWIP